jgi:hypothetical protein
VRGEEVVAGKASDEALFAALRRVLGGENA